MTIGNSHRGRGKGIRSPATSLLPRPTNEASPLANDPTHRGLSARQYKGWFHTDHLVPSAFFEDSQPSVEYGDLDFSYIHDPATSDHAELMAGQPATGYEIRRDVWIDEKKPGVFAESSFERDDRVRAFQWLESRIAARCR